MGLLGRKKKQNAGESKGVEDLIELDKSFLLPITNNSLEVLARSVFQDFAETYQDLGKQCSTAILTPRKIMSI